MSTVLADLAERSYSRYESGRRLDMCIDNWQTEMNVAMQRFGRGVNNTDSNDLVQAAFSIVTLATEWWGDSPADLGIVTRPLDTITRFDCGIFPVGNANRDRQPWLTRVAEHELAFDAASSKSDAFLATLLRRHVFLPDSDRFPAASFPAQRPDRGWQQRAVPVDDWHQDATLVLGLTGHNTSRWPETGDALQGSTASLDIANRDGSVGTVTGDAVLYFAILKLQSATVAHRREYEASLRPRRHL